MGKRVVFIDFHRFSTDFSPIFDDFHPFLLLIHLFRAPKGRSLLRCIRRASES